MSIKKKKGERVTLTEIPVYDFDEDETFIGTFVETNEKGHLFLEDATNEKFIIPLDEPLDKAMAQLVNGEPAWKQNFTWFIDRNAEGLYKIEVE